jgi:arylsulfatase A-like enzyme
MSGSPKWFLRLVLASLAVALAWGLWPLAEDRWEIRDDPAAAAAVRAFLADTGKPPEARPPNIVLMVADDLGKHDVSLYGPSPVATPALAELAAGGVTFEHGYVVSPVCSPSRAALLTGRYPQRFGFELLTHDRYPVNRIEWWFARTFFSTHGFHTLARPTAPAWRDAERQGIPAGEVTLAELLRKQGYRTGIFGKWHLGFGEEMLPQARGFEEHYGFYDAFSLYADEDDPNIASVRGRYFVDRYQWWRGRSGGSAIRQNGKIVEEPEYLTAAIAREASEWIEARRDEPFFAYVPFNAPHAPLQAPRNYVARLSTIGNHDQRIYYAMVAALDDAVGRVLAALDRIGARDNTLVIFLSDNGAASYMEIVDNRPLNGGKLTNFEGGVNVPFVMRWPGTIPPGTRYSHAVSALDVFATAAAAAGVATPSVHPLDGVDLAPFVQGHKTTPPHEMLFWRTGGHRAVRAGSYKLVSDAITGSQALFDLDADPSEQNDLVASEPDRAKRLANALAAWEAELRSPRWPPVMEYRFTIGGHRFVFPL